MTARSGPKPFYGFYIVAACFVILFLLWGMVMNTFPIFLKPITENMQWGRGALSVAMVVGSVAAAVTAPVAGILLDRIGVRAIMLTGTLAIGLAQLGGSQLTALWHVYVVFAVIGCGLMCATVIPCSLLISNWFAARRGAAMSVAFAGTSVGGMVMSPIANWIILTYGWRTAFACSGGIILMLVLPVVLLVIRTRPSEMGLEPYRDAAATAGDGTEDGGVTLSDAIRVRAFWQIAAVMILIGLVTSGLGSHCVAYLTDLDHSPTRAAFAWSLVMAAMVIGKLSVGFIADQWGAKHTMAGACVLIATAIATLTFAEPYWVVLAFACTYGFALGAPLVVNPLLAGDYLGMRHFGAIYGALNLLSTVGAAAGPVGAGMFFDARHTYVPVFYVFVVLMLLGAGVAVAMTPVAEHARHTRQPVVPRATTD